MFRRDVLVKKCDMQIPRCPNAKMPLAGGVCVSGDERNSKIRGIFSRGGCVQKSRSLRVLVILCNLFGMVKK